MEFININVDALLTGWPDGCDEGENRRTQRRRSDIFLN